MGKSTIDGINGAYDSAMFGGDTWGIDKIGFFNFGYWRGVEDSVELAQINLIETLIGFLANRTGNILDVACGKGASTKFLTKYFNPKNITGINISEKQLQLGRLIAPECNFRLMDAATLDFADSSIDNMLCIEAAFHFETRQRFLEEAFRVLKPGGRLAMSDLLHDEYLLDLWAPNFPKENYLASVDELRDGLMKAGFRYVRVEDSSEFCVKALCRFLTRRMEAQPDREPGEITNLVRFFDHYIGSCMAYAMK